MLVQELLCHPNRWSKGGSAAYDSKGKACDPCADEAVQWTLDGAIKRCYVNTYYEQNSNDAYKKVAYHPKVMGFVSWFNDARYRTYEEIMEVVREVGI